jgi:hypothetical protein
MTKSAIIIASLYGMRLNFKDVLIVSLPILSNGSASASKLSHHLDFNVKKTGVTFNYRLLTEKNHDSQITISLTNVSV